MDIFDIKGIHPMLIKEMQPAFNDPAWIYELKLDGIRCIAYLDSNCTDLRNKRNFALIAKFPELSTIHQQVKNKCILDGELVVLKNGVPDFYELQRRTILTDKFKIQRAYMELPASFVTYDIIYQVDHEIVDLPLIERKKMLSSVVVESPRIAVSRYIEEYGIELYNMTVQNQLEGVVGKRKDSRYQYDKRSKEWVKFKRVADEELVIVGFIRKRPMNTLLLAKFNGEKLIYRGAVQFGVRLDTLFQHNCKIIPYSPFTRKPDNKVEDETGEVTWIEPALVCTVEYMPNTKNSLRQAVFKGIREDINPYDCQI
jgi:ATP-dependent DNA ligase